MSVMIYQKSANSWINFCVCDYRFVAHMIKKQMENVQWVLVLIWAFLLYFFMIQYYVLGRKHTGNGQWQSNCFFVLSLWERGNLPEPQSSRGNAHFVWKKSEHIYVHLNFLERELTLQYVEDLLDLVRIGLAVFTVKGCPVLSWTVGLLGMRLLERKNLKDWA